MEIDPKPSAAAEVESDVNLAEGLADKAGQETAPITGLTSATTPLDVFFQAGFLRLALTTLLILSALELLLSTTTAAAVIAATRLAESRDNDEETDCGGGGGGD